MKLLKRKILMYLTKNLLKAINEDDILKMTSQGLVLRGRKLSPDEERDLREEAREINNSQLWEFMKTELEWVAFVRGRKAKTDEDNIACHYLFYNIDIIQQFLNNLGKK